MDGIRKLPCDGVVCLYTCQICQNPLERPPTIQRTRSNVKLVALECGHVIHHHCLLQFFGREGDRSDGKIKCPDPRCKERYVGIPKTHEVVLQQKSIPVNDLPAVKTLESDFKLKLAQEKKRVDDMTDEMTRVTEQNQNLTQQLAAANERVAVLERNQRLPLENIMNSPRRKQ